METFRNRVNYGLVAACITGCDRMVAIQLNVLRNEEATVGLEVGPQAGGSRNHVRPTSVT